MTLPVEVLWVVFWLYTIASASALLIGLARAYKWGYKLLAVHQDMLILQEHFKQHGQNWLFYDGAGH